MPKSKPKPKAKPGASAPSGMENKPGKFGGGKVTDKGVKK